MSEQGTEAPHVTALRQFEYFRFGVYVRKLQMARISSQIIRNREKFYTMKNG